MKKYYLLFVTVLAWNSLFAVKVGYIDSNRIMGELDEVMEVQVELEKEQRKLESEMENLINQLDSLQQSFEKQKILMGPDRIQQKEMEIRDLRLQIEQFQMSKFGPQGDIYKLQNDLLAPVLSKIDAAIQEVGAAKGYDFILDAVSGALVYALDAHNLTDEIIDELKKSENLDTNSP